MCKLIVKNNIIAVDYRPFGVAIKSVEPMLHLAKTPIVILVGEMEYRVVPQYPEAAVSSTGRIIAVKDKAAVKPAVMGDYMRISTYDTVNGRHIQVSIHRLVAMAWCSNDDYVKRNIVDHIDGNKLNNTADNLRWVTHSENKRNKGTPGVNRFGVLDLDTGDKTYFPSQAAAAISLCVNRGNISGRRLPQLVRTSLGNYLVYHISGEASAIDACLEQYYNLCVYKKGHSGSKAYFKTKHEVCAEYGVRVYPRTLAAIEARLNKTGYVLVNLSGQGHAKLYDVLNADTGEEHRGLLLREVVERTGRPRGTVISRTNRKYKYGHPMGSWILKLATDKEYPVRSRDKKPLNKGYLVNGSII